MNSAATQKDQIYLIQMVEEINRSESTGGTLLELLNIARSMSDDQPGPVPNSALGRVLNSQQVGEGTDNHPYHSFNSVVPNMGLTPDDIDMLVVIQWARDSDSIVWRYVGVLICVRYLPQT